MDIVKIDNSRSKNGRFRWRTRYGNGEIGVWSEHYHNRADRDRSIELHQAELASAEIKEAR